MERWLSVPAHKGRGAGLTFCDKLAEYCDDAVPVAELRQYLIARSSYVVVVGYTKKGLLWADYGNGKTKGAVRARAIAEQFASPVE